MIGILRGGARFSIPRASVALENRTNTGESLGVTAFALALLVGEAFALAATASGN